MKIDIRFVSSDQSFPYPAKEVCTQPSSDSRVNNFLNRSLNHTNVKLTWEDPNNSRFDHVNQKFINSKDDQKIDWAEYIGEVSDDEDLVQEDQEEDQDWQVDEKELDDPFGYDKKNRKRSMDMEITFNQGFEDIANKITDK